jgi:hypothetical protein
MIIHAVAAADSWSEVKPGRHWWSAFLAATAAAMQPPQQQQRGSSAGDTSDGGSSGSDADDGITPAYSNPQGSNPQGFTPQGFSVMVWALGKLQRRPGADWAAVLYAATRDQLPGFSPQGLSNLGLGLASMGALGLPRPDRAWAEAYVAAAVDARHGFSSQGLANLLW